MTVAICDRCGDVTVGGDRCRCFQPYDPVDVRRRHRSAVARARVTDAYAKLAARKPGTTRAA